MKDKQLNMFPLLSKKLESTHVGISEPIVQHLTPVFFWPE